MFLRTDEPTPEMGIQDNVAVLVTSVWYASNMVFDSASVR